MRSFDIVHSKYTKCSINQLLFCCGPLPLLLPSYSGLVSLGVHDLEHFLFDPSQGIQSTERNSDMAIGLPSHSTLQFRVETLHILPTLRSDSGWGGDFLFDLNICSGGRKRRCSTLLLELLTFPIRPIPGLLL